MKITVKEINQKLKEYSELKYNWDAYGGLPVEKDVLNSAYQLFSIIENSNIPLPNPMVGGDNEIGFYIIPKFLLKFPKSFVSCFHLLKFRFSIFLILLIIISNYYNKE